MGVVFSGRLYEIPGVKSISYLEDATLRLGPDDRTTRQTTWVRSIVLHRTTGDLPQRVEPLAGPGGGARNIIADQRKHAEVHAGQHGVMDCDGTFYNCADLRTEATYHARAINDVSIGIELKEVFLQGAWTIWADQVKALVRLIDWLTLGAPDPDDASHLLLGAPIQRQFQFPYLGENHPVARLAAGGHDCVGIFGHRDQDPCDARGYQSRGPGDPGDYVFQILAEAGYEQLNFQGAPGADPQDIRLWKLRQTNLNSLGASLTADGVPGPATCEALRRYQGFARGLWTGRPND